MSDNNINIKTSKQTFDFNLTLGQKINLEIANINGEIYISNKPENSSKSINDQNIFNKKEFSNRFTRVQLENESYKDIKPITDDFNSSIYNILSKQNIDADKVSTNLVEDEIIKNSSTTDDFIEEDQSTFNEIGKDTDLELDSSNEETEGNSNEKEIAMDDDTISNDEINKDEEVADYSNYYIPLEDEEDEEDE